MARRIWLPHDYLNLWLTGEFATEAGDASGTAYLDVRTRDLCPGRAALPRRRPRLGRGAAAVVLVAGAVLGSLRPEAAEALGLPAGIPGLAWAAATTCARRSASARCVPGVAVMSLGTSGTVFGHATAPAIDPAARGLGVLRLDRRLAAARVRAQLHARRSSGYAACSASTTPAFDALVSGVPAGARGLTFVPYLDGERTPNRPDASGELLGLRTHHGPAEVSRAVLEGVTAGLAHAVRAFRRTGTAADELLLVGGAARSEVWGQLLADWLDLPIARPSVAEAAARGAAIQAAHVIGGAPDSSPRRDRRPLGAARRHRRGRDRRRLRQPADPPPSPPTEPATEPDRAQPRRSTMADPFFTGVPDRIPFGGSDSTDPLAFKAWEPERMVLGKRMVDWLRPGVCFWHSFAWDGRDMFGVGTLDRPWNAAGPDPMAAARQKMAAAFEFFTKLGTPYYCFHDTRRRARRHVPRAQGEPRRARRRRRGLPGADRRPAPVGHGEPVHATRATRPAPRPTPIPRCSPTPPRRSPTCSPSPSGWAARTTSCGAAARATTRCSTPTSGARASSWPGS